MLLVVMMILWLLPVVVGVVDAVCIGLKVKISRWWWRCWSALADDEELMLWFERW